MRMEQLAEQLNARKTGAGRWMARCPAHDDRTPSLSLRRGRDGRNLLHCFGAGCALKDIARAMGLSVKELVTDTSTSGVRLRCVRPQTVTEIALAMAREQRWAAALPDYEVAD